MNRIILRDGSRRRRPNPVLALYRWRYELAVVGVLVALVRLGQVIHWAAPLAVVTSVVVVVAMRPEARRAVQDRCWAVVIQHRLRTAFRELGLTTWAGRVPAILWTAPRVDGLYVYVSCPAGVGPGELAAAHEPLAAACFASEVRVARHPRYANVVELVVTRIGEDGEK